MDRLTGLQTVYQRYEAQIWYKVVHAERTQWYDTVTWPNSLTRDVFCC
jgi:hypothetical protein